MKLPTGKQRAAVRCTLLLNVAVLLAVVVLVAEAFLALKLEAFLGARQPALVAFDVDRHGACARTADAILAGRGCTKHYWSFLPPGPSNWNV